MDALQNHGVSPEQTDTLPAWVDDFNDRVTSPTLPECFAPMKGDLADYSSLLFEYKQLLDVLLNVGLVNRMFHVELAASPRLWLEWAAQNNIHPYIYDYIPSRPDHLWSKPPQERGTLLYPSCLAHAQRCHPQFRSGHRYGQPAHSGRWPETRRNLLPDMKTWPDNADASGWYYLTVQEATNGHTFERKEDRVHERWIKLK